MPLRPSKNTTAKLIEFPNDLATEVERFSKSRGETFKKVVTDALRRHMDNPPPPPVVPPLPPLPPVATEKPKRGRKKKSAE